MKKYRPLPENPAAGEIISGWVAHLLDRRTARACRPSDTPPQELGRSTNSGKHSMSHNAGIKVFSPRVSGTSVSNKIEITPQMIEAGVAELVTFGDWDQAREAVERVFRAMAAECAR